MYILQCGECNRIVADQCDVLRIKGSEAHLHALSCHVQLGDSRPDEYVDENDDVHLIIVKDIKCTCEQTLGKVIISTPSALNVERNVPIIVLDRVQRSPVAGYTPVLATDDKSYESHEEFIKSMRVRQTMIEDTLLAINVDIYSLLRCIGSLLGGDITQAREQKPESPQVEPKRRKLKLRDRSKLKSSSNIDLSEFSDLVSGSESNVSKLNNGSDDERQKSKDDLSYDNEKEKAAKRADAGDIDEEDDADDISSDSVAQKVVYQYEDATNDTISAASKVGEKRKLDDEITYEFSDDEDGSGAHRLGAPKKAVIACNCDVCGESFTSTEAKLAHAREAHQWLVGK